MVEVLNKNHGESCSCKLQPGVQERIQLKLSDHRSRICGTLHNAKNDLLNISPTSDRSKPTGHTSDRSKPTGSTSDRSNPTGRTSDRSNPTGSTSDRSHPLDPPLPPPSTPFLFSRYNLQK
uniref:Uncharacterized protein n=1 Tax=Amphiprion percula TaxID=161767 RepID=A0A3P8RSJ4_AMPPE